MDRCSDGEGCPIGTYYKIIMLSMYTEYAADAMTVEADAFFSKGAPPEQLLDTLTTVAAHLEKKESDNAAAGY